MTRPDPIIIDRWHTDMTEKVWVVTCPCGESSGQTDHMTASRWAGTHRCKT